MTWHIWTPAEDRFIIRNHKKMSLTQLSAHLGVRRSAVHNRKLILVQPEEVPVAECVDCEEELKLLVRTQVVIHKKTRDTKCCPVRMELVRLERTCA